MYARPIVPVALAVIWLSASTAAADPDAERPEDSAETQEQTAKNPPRIVERVVVRSTAAQDRRDAVTLTDLTKERITEVNRGQDMATILADTPNAYAYSDSGAGVGYSYLSLRGFRQERIATYINGVPLNTAEAHAVYFIDLADLAGSLGRIQVQRGTATALHGSPEVGGAVNLETEPLSATEGGLLRLGAGSFGTGRAYLRYGSSFAGGSWAWMASAAHVESDGYRRPSWTRHSMFHLALERYGQDSVLRIHAFGGPERTQLAYYGVPVEYLRGEITGDADRDRRENPMLPGETDTFVQPHLQVIHDWRIAPGVFLENTGYVIVGRGHYRQYSDLLEKLYGSYAADGTPEESSLVPIRDAWRKRWIGSEQLGWLPRLSWDHRRGNLTAGLLLQAYSGHHEGTVTDGSVCTAAGSEDPCSSTEPLGEPRTLYDYRTRKKTASAFIRETFEPSARIALSAEVQAVWHSFAMRRDLVRGLSFDTSYGFVSPRLGLNWNLDDRWNVYASYSAAASEPTFDNVWTPQDPTAAGRDAFRTFDAGRHRFSDPLAEPEKARSYEVGAGFRSGANRLKVSVYRMDFRDEFVPQGGLDVDGLPITVNAGRSRHRGVELEGAARLPLDVEASGYFAASRDELREFTVYGTSEDGVPFAVDYSGNRIAWFPESLARVNLSRRFGPARVTLGARRVGTIYLDNSEDERKDPAARDAAGYVPKRIDPYVVADLRAAIDLRPARGSRSSLVLEIWVDNLLDERYEAMGYSYANDDFTSFYTEFFPAATRSAYVGVSFAF